MSLTAAMVRDALTQAGIPRIDHHSCGGCGYMTAYLIAGDQVAFDAGCDCTRRSVWEARTFQDLADWINRQSRPEVRRALLERCGLGQEDTP